MSPLTHPAGSAGHPRVFTRGQALPARGEEESPRELLVLEPVRNDAVEAQSPLLVFLVVGEIALEPLDVAVALEGEDVGRDAVEKPAVVADDHGAAGEILKRLLQCTERVDVEVVGRLVEEENVGAGLEHLGEVDAVTLAAGELADLLLLVAALEVEGAAIGARIDLALAEWRRSGPPEISSQTVFLPSSASRDWST